MPCFVVKTEHDLKVLGVVNAIRKNRGRLDSKASFFIPSFEVKVFLHKTEFLTAFNIYVCLPPIYYVGFLFVVLAFLFSRAWLLIPALLFFFTYIFFSSYWFAWVFKRALRKEGYEGPVKVLNYDSALRGVVFGSDRII
jgi:hypothetical protein